jgi:hypothetical protein
MRNNQICRNCGLTFLSHKRVSPFGFQCPLHEGFDDWPDPETDAVTYFSATDKYEDIPLGTPSKRLRHG